MKYTALDKINLFLSFYGRLFSAIFRISLWFPFLILALIQSSALLGLLWYYKPGFNNIVFPILSLILPAQVFHYPQYYLVLPSIYTFIDGLIIGPTLWVILSAASVYKLGGYFSDNGRKLSDGFSKAVKSYWPLLLFWLIETCLALIVLFVPSNVLSSYIVGSPRAKFALELALQLFSLGISSFLIFTIPGVMIGGKGVGQAMADSIRLCFHNMILTYSIVLIPNLIRIGVDLVLTNYAINIVSKLDPALIMTIILFKIVSGIFINLFVYGAAVGVYTEMSD